MRILFFTMLTIALLFGSETQTLSAKERTALLEKVKQTKKLKRQMLKEKFKKAHTQKLRQKLRYKLKKSHFQKENRLNKIKQKIHKLKVSP